MHICPIIVEEWSAGVVTTQHLLERHMFAANVKFAEAPKTLIIQVIPQFCSHNFYFSKNMLYFGLFLVASLRSTKTVR